MTGDLVAQVAAEDTSLLVHPGTGEITLVDDPVAVAQFLESVRELGRRVQEARKDAESALVEYASTIGARTFELDGMKVEVRQSDDITWDVEVLEQLLMAGPNNEPGLPDTRWNELVTQTVSVKVSTTVAKQIAGANERYADIVAKAQTRTPKPVYVSVKT